MIFMAPNDVHVTFFSLFQTRQKVYLLSAVSMTLSDRTKNFLDTRCVFADGAGHEPNG